MKYLFSLIIFIFAMGGCGGDGGGGSGGNTSPTLSIDNDTISGVNSTAIINYTAGDPDDMAAISFFYDTDQNGFDGTQIVSGLVENDGPGNYAWLTSAVPEGLYFIYGQISDGTNSAVTTPYRPQPFIVFHSGPVIPPYTVIQELTESSGSILIDYDLWEVNGASHNIYVEYRGGSVGPTWTPATLLGPDTFVPGGPSWIRWDSGVDESGITSSDYQVRIWAEAMSSGTVGPPSESVVFTASN